MKTRTLSMFFEEKGIDLIELSEKIGVPTEDLEPVGALHFVPVDIASKIICEYALPENYFTEDTESLTVPSKERSFGYFLIFSLVWAVILTASVGLLSVPLTMIAAFIRDGIEPKITALLSTIVTEIIAIFSCIIISKIICKNIKSAGDFAKYKYLLHIVPSAVLLPSILPNLFMNQEIIGNVNSSDFSVPNLLNTSFFMVLISLIISIIEIFLRAVMMKNAFGEPTDKKRKIINILLIVACISASIYYLTELILFPSPNGVIFQVTDSAAEVLLLVAIALGVVIGSKNKPELDKVWFTVLPICTFVLDIIGAAVSAVISF